MAPENLLDRCKRSARHSVRAWEMSWQSVLVSSVTFSGGFASGSFHLPFPGVRRLFGGPLGIGSLIFGMPMRYLGLLPGMSVALGFCSAFGAFIPPIYREFARVEGVTFSGLFASDGGRWARRGLDLPCGYRRLRSRGNAKERELSPAVSTSGSRRPKTTRSSWSCGRSTPASVP